MSEIITQSHTCPACEQRWQCGSCRDGAHAYYQAPSLCPMCLAESKIVSSNVYRYFGEDYYFKYIDDFAVWVAEVRKEHGL